MQHSFAGIMQQTVHIGYKALYEKEHAANVLMQQTLDLLKHELAQLKKIVFGSKSKRFVATGDNKPNPRLSLELDAETIAQCKITDVTKFTVTRTKTQIIRNLQNCILAE